MDVPPPPIYAKSNDLNTTFATLSSTYDKLCSESAVKVQNLQYLGDLLTAYEGHWNDATQWIENQERLIVEAEGLPNDKAGLDLAKLRFEEMGRQTGEFQNQVDRLTAINGDIQMRTENKAEEVRRKQEELVGRWEDLKRGCHDRMRALDGVSFFLHSCDQMHVWLMQKQKMISVLGKYVRKEGRSCLCWDPVLYKIKRRQ